MANPELEPDLSNMETYVTISEERRGYEGTVYVAKWRGTEATGDTVPEALKELSTQLKDAVTIEKAKDAREDRDYEDIDTERYTKDDGSE